MQFRQLRQLLNAIVLPVAMGGCAITDLVTDDDDCSRIERQTLHAAEPAEPAQQLKIDRCRVDVDACMDLCSDAMTRASIQSTPRTCDVTFSDDDVAIKVSYEVYTGGPNCPVDGRRPSGLATPDRLPARSAAGAWLAQAAWLEAASVYAFLHLAQELATHEAPRALVKLALAAANDEVRHTAMMTRLAQRYGGAPPPVEVALPGARSLEELAIENAAEGCVRETWGAVIALWQAHVARDPEVRTTFVQIAKDEARHAALAWAVDAWVRPLLDDAARARVDAARDRAARELFEGEAQQIVALGLPTTDQARALYTRTYQALWNGGHS